MAIEVSNGVTRITPTAWKWYAGAGALALIALVMPDHGWAWGLGALFFAVFGTGKLSSIQLDRQKLTIKHMFGTKQYRWNEITDFRLMKIKSGLMTAGTMVSFTKVKQEGTMYAKAAKFLSGGTHSTPGLGMKPKTLLILMSAYQQNLIVSDEIIAKILGKAKFTKTDQRNVASGIVVPNARRKSGEGMSAADLAIQKAVAERRSTGGPQGAAGVNVKPARQSKFGQAKPTSTAKPTFGKSSTSAPLVEDSRARRRRIGS